MKKEKGTWIPIDSQEAQGGVLRGFITYPEGLLSARSLCSQGEGREWRGLGTTGRGRGCGGPSSRCGDCTQAVTVGGTLWFLRRISASSPPLCLPNYRLSLKSLEEARLLDFLARAKFPSPRSVAGEVWGGSPEACGHVYSSRSCKFCPSVKKATSLDQT